ncbi:MAG: hypothetical protein ACH255_11920 [Candidatus Thiodiazotropha sp.]
MKDRFLTRKEAAEYLNERGLTYSANTLQKFATIGGGPRYQIFGIRAVYTITDLDNWIESKLSDPHSSVA